MVRITNDNDKSVELSNADFSEIRDALYKQAYRLDIDAATLPGMSGPEHDEWRRGLQAHADALRTIWRRLLPL